MSRPVDAANEPVLGLTCSEYLLLRQLALQDGPRPLEYLAARVVGQTDVSGVARDLRALRHAGLVREVSEGFGLTAAGSVTAG